MNRTARLILLASSCLFVAAATVGIADAAKADDGQELYKEYCKSCHEEGSEYGEYTPMTLIQSQWERFFDKKYERAHEGVIDATHGDTPVLELIDEETLEKIREFSIDHAADSEHPMTCG